MTTLHLLALAGYFFVLYEYIAMRHRVICAESDVRIDAQFLYGRTPLNRAIWRAQKLYWNRGTK